ncbi:hypothetical protein [Actinokineospora enzanensis]|uniref:hypothetical protein n=1 Tax=Actinokineospora enzanensis TaxID=155975 RepID=UPI000361BC7E|nr:hypothetical protein [Actinokineospora enzanensis]
MRWFRKRASKNPFWAHNAWMESRMRDTAVSLPLFGLAGWSGLRMPGWWTFADEWQPETGSLRHGDPNDPTARTILVCTTLGDPIQAVRSLRFSRATAGMPTDRQGMAAARRLVLDDEPSGSTRITVAGRAIESRLWTYADSWQAYCRIDDCHSLVLDAYRFDPAEVALVRVHDFEACLADRRDWIRAYYE